MSTPPPPPPSLVDRCSRILTFPHLLCREDRPGCWRWGHGPRDSLGWGKARERIYMSSCHPGSELLLPLLCNASVPAGLHFPSLLLQSPYTSCTGEWLSGLQDKFRAWTTLTNFKMAFSISVLKRSLAIPPSSAGMYSPSWFPTSSVSSLKFLPVSTHCSKDHKFLKMSCAE